MTSTASDASRLPVNLDALFRRYALELNNFAYGRLRDRDAAADVVQDAFVRFIALDRQLHRLPDSAAPVSPRFFLWRIVGNLTIDIARRKQRRGVFASIDDVAHQLVDPAPTQDRWLEARQQWHVLKSALDELTSAQRDALLLNRIDGLTHAEIGDRMSVSASMVSKYIMAALRLCLKRLEAAGF